MPAAVSDERKVHGIEIANRAVEEIKLRWSATCEPRLRTFKTWKTALMAGREKLQRFLSSREEALKCEIEQCVDSHFTTRTSDEGFFRCCLDLLSAPVHTVCERRLELTMLDEKCPPARTTSPTTTALQDRQSSQASFTDASVRASSSVNAESDDDDDSVDLNDFIDDSLFEDDHTLEMQLLKKQMKEGMPHFREEELARIDRESEIRKRKLAATEEIEVDSGDQSYNGSDDHRDDYGIILTERALLRACQVIAEQPGRQLTHAQCRQLKELEIIHRDETRARAKIYFDEMLKRHSEQMRRGQKRQRQKPFIVVSEAEEDEVDEMRQIVMSNENVNVDDSLDEIQLISTSQNNGGDMMSPYSIVSRELGGYKLRVPDVVYQQHQIEGIAFLMRQTQADSGAILAHSMGLGKVCSLN